MKTSTTTKTLTCVMMDQIDLHEYMVTRYDKNEKEVTQSLSYKELKDLFWTEDDVLFFFNTIRDELLTNEEIQACLAHAKVSAYTNVDFCGDDSLFFTAPDELLFDIVLMDVLDLTDRSKVQVLNAGIFSYARSLKFKAETSGKPMDQILKEVA